MDFNIMNDNQFKKTFIIPINSKKKWWQFWKKNNTDDIKVTMEKYKEIISIDNPESGFYIPTNIEKDYSRKEEENSQLKYQDLLYFGYDWSDESAENKKNQSDFIIEIKQKFPNVKLVNAYDSIKGFRQEVYIEEKDNDDYYSWVMAKGWFEASFGLTLMSMSPDAKQKESFNKYFDLAKKQYPESFKPESL